MTKNTRLTVHFTDFWAGFDAQRFWLHRMLSQEYALSLDPRRPELLVFCDYGIDHLRYTCPKIYYSHENTRKHAALFDYSFCFHGRGRKHQFFSNLVEEPFFQEVRTGAHSEAFSALHEFPKTKFCNFIYSNPSARERVKFCQQLMRYKHVDCPGKVLNNHPPFDSHGYRYDKKLEFMRSYRFTIAFENESASGYTTEKILHPFITGSIPIYWGNPDVAKLFNPRSFVNCHDYPNFHAVIERVKEIDSNEGLFRSYASEPAILPSSPLFQLSEQFLCARLKEIVETTRLHKVVSRSPYFPMLRRLHWLGYKLRNRVVYSLQCIQQCTKPRKLCRS